LTHELPDLNFFPPTENAFLLNQAGSGLISANVGKPVSRNNYRPHLEKARNLECFGCFLKIHLFM
jgi:hypothetical protein